MTRLELRRQPAKSGKECGLVREIMAKIKEILNYKDRTANGVLSLKITSYWQRKFTGQMMLLRGINTA